MGVEVIVFDREDNPFARAKSPITTLGFFNRKSVADGQKAGGNFRQNSINVGGEGNIALDGKIKTLKNKGITGNLRRRRNRSIRWKWHGCFRRRKGLKR